MNILKRLYKFFSRHELSSLTLLLSLSIFLLFCRGYKLFSIESWRFPLGYAGDGLFGLALAKGYMLGEFNLLSKKVETLGAPFIADWSAYPVTEEIIFKVMAILGNYIGLFTAANVILFLAHLMAGLTFWFVCRYYKYNILLSFSGAIAYAFCHYLLVRGFGHVILSFFWCIPVVLLIVAKVYSDYEYKIKDSFFIFSAIFSFIVGFFNPYYTLVYIQLLFFSIIVKVIRKKYSQILFPSLLIIIAFSSFILVNLDTLLSPHRDITGLRNLAAMEVFALKLPELFFTATGHPWQAFSNFSHANYYNVAFVKGEVWSPYLGLFGILGFLSLIGYSIYHLILGKLRNVPLNFWHSMWIILFSLLGGLNLVIGVFGLQVFRATNRLSIFLLTISLLFLIQMLSKYTPKILVLPLALMIAFFGFAEQYGIRYHAPPELTVTEKKVIADEIFVKTLEDKYPHSNVFMMPIAVFPEQGSFNKMVDYDHFRPYLHSKTLHYSYGDFKGTSNAGWQISLRNLSIKDLLNVIENNGFHLIIINRTAYEDSGTDLINSILSDDRLIVSENQDLVAIKLRVPTDIKTMKPWISFGDGWSPDEITHRWAEKIESSLVISNLNPKNITQSISFDIVALTKRKITILVNNNVINTINIDDVEKGKKTVNLSLELPVGNSIVTFRSDQPPVSPNNGDPRTLVFSISSITLKSIE